jgi:hypothetical protein
VLKLSLKNAKKTQEGSFMSNVNEAATVQGIDSPERFDHDGFWKALIKRFFPSLLKRALPKLYEDADISQAPEFLDKEFMDVLSTGDPKIRNSPYFADYLMDVAMKNGRKESLLFHVEAQGKGGGQLAERMHHYECLIYAHFRKEPVALVITTDKRPKHEPRFYAHCHYDTEVVYRYNNLVLEDLDDKELLASDNPIDMGLYAAKHARQTKEELQKYTYLRTLAGLLGERGWSVEDKRDLLLFIEWILSLKDKDLQTKYWEYRQQLDKEGKVVYVSFLKDVEERMAEARGIEKMAKDLLANGISPEVIAKSSGLPLDRVQALLN